MDGKQQRQGSILAAAGAAVCLFVGMTCLPAGLQQATTLYVGLGGSPRRSCSRHAVLQVLLLHGVSSSTGSSARRAAANIIVDVVHSRTSTHPLVKSTTHVMHAHMQDLNGSTTHKWCLCAYCTITATRPYRPSKLHLTLCCWAPLLLCCDTAAVQLVWFGVSGRCCALGLPCACVAHCFVLGTDYSVHLLCLHQQPRGCVLWRMLV